MVNPLLTQFLNLFQCGKALVHTYLFQCGKALAVLAVVCAIILGLVFTAIFTQTTAPPEVHDGWFGRGPAQRDDDTSVREFKVNVSEDVLNDLVYRLDHARLFEDLEDTEFQYGFRVQYLKDVIRYWKEEYDWRLHETELNRFPQFLTKIEGIDVHFLHVKTPNGVGKGSMSVYISGIRSDFN